MSQQIETLQGRANGSHAQPATDRIQQLIEANERLKSIDQRKNEGLAVLSHDLRTPLNVQLGHAYLLMKDPNLSEAQRASVETIERTSRKILGLIERILDSARSSDHAIDLVGRSTDLASVCHEVASELDVLAQTKGIRLTVDVPERLMVFGDDQMLRQVLQNLVSNAITHAVGASVIAIRGREESRGARGAIRIEVQDDGHVEDPTMLLRAFETPRGLGLAICRHFVERHGGRIQVAAPTEGGAMFSFVLPREGSKAFQRRAPTTALSALRDRDDMVLLLDAEISRSARYARPLTVACIRPRADTNPHVERSADTIAAAIRATDALGYGGDGSFLLIFPETSGTVVTSLIARIVGRLEGAAMSWHSTALEVGDVAVSAETLIAQLLA